MDRYKNIPTAEEFNRKMDECVEYQKLNKLKEHLQWFRGKVGDIDITNLEKHIDKRIEEIPKELGAFLISTVGSWFQLGCVAEEVISPVLVTIGCPDNVGLVNLVSKIKCVKASTL